MLALIVPQVCRNRASPVNISRAGTARSLPPVDRSANRTQGFVLEPGEQLIHNPPHHHAFRFFRLLRNRGPQRHQVGYQMNIGFKC